MRRIAVGGMAEIYIARHQGMKGFSRNIVIKKIRSHLSKEKSFVTMFLNEAKLAAQINHSNIAQIYDLGRVGDSYFIAMEYVRGRDLRTVVAKAQSVGIPFPLEYTLLVACEVCEGLFYAHRKVDDQAKPLNIVHRDVTPENIMVSFDGEVKVLDFGIAKAENMATETKVGELKGKLGYMSPEQIMGKTVDQRSDLYSLGVVLYEVLTHHKLFSGKHDVDVMRNVVEGNIYPPSYFNKDIPQAVEEIIMRCLERNRVSRYQSAWEVQVDIRQFLSQHEFDPSSIHLSNFMRQIFSDQIQEDDSIICQANAQPDEPEGEITDSVLITDFLTQLPQSDDSALPIDDGATQKNGPNGQPIGKNGNCRIDLDLGQEQYDRIVSLAERNGLSVSAFIREVLLQYTRFI